MIHLDLMCSWNMPIWGWLLLIAPTAGTSLMSCLFGLTLWCDLVWAAMALNLLELCIFPFFSTKTTMTDGTKGYPTPDIHGDYRPFIIPRDQTEPDYMEPVITAG